MKFLKKVLGYKVTVWILVLFIGAVCLAWLGGYLASPLTSDTDSAKVDTNIAYIEKVNEVVFLNAGIEKLISAEDSTKILGVELPFSKKSALMIMHYKAKFGIKKPVKIKQTGEKSFEVKVPAFEVIGFELDKDSYKLYDRKGEVLSYSTKEIDTGKYVTKELSKKEQENYMKNYKQDIKDSATNYYKNLLQSVVPDSNVTVKFD